MDSWPEWYRWSLHNVWFQRDNGGLTQSARITQPVRTVQTGAGWVRVEVDGAIPTSNSRWDNVLTQAPTYHRTFVVDASGVHVTTDVGPAHPTDQLAHVVETIPLNSPSFRYYGLPYVNATGNPAWDQVTITLQDATGIPIDPLAPWATPEAWYDDIVEVVFTRLGGELRVRFDQPERVMITDPYCRWQTFDPAFADGEPMTASNPDPDDALTRSTFRNRNLVIDLVGTAGSGTSSGFTGRTTGYHLSTF